METAAGAVVVPTRFSLVRTSVRDQVPDGNSLVRTSGVGGGGENLILKTCVSYERVPTQNVYDLDAQIAIDFKSNLLAI